MDLAPFAAFLVASLVGLGLSALTFVFARRSGLAPFQSKLIETLQDNAAALEMRVSQLEAALTDERAERERLAGLVTRLRETVSELAIENAELRRKLKMPPRAEP